MRTWGMGSVLVALALLGSGCNDGEETTPSGGDDTSGGETTGGGSTSSSGGATSGGSSSGGQASSDGQPSDPNDLEAGAEEVSSNTGSDSASHEDPTEPENPWGQPDAESGAPLPARPDMNASARSAFQRGLSAGQQGNTAAARTAFDEALRSDPQAYRAAYNLGVLADREGQTDQALTYYRQALRIQADYERAAEGIVTVYLRRGQVNDAVSFIEPLANRWTRNLYLQAVYGEALIRGDRLDQAVTAARSALRRDERFVPAMIVLVKAYLDMGRTELAESILDQALGVDDTNAELHFLKGRMAAQQENLAVALREYRRAVELRPDYADARMALAIQLLEGANYTEALQQFQAVNNLVAGMPEVHIGLGNAYRATKQWTKAKEELDAVLQSVPQSADAHFALGLVFMEAADQYPGLDLLTSLQRSQREFQAYQEIMGPRLARDDASTAYLEQLARLIEREQRRIEREAAQAAREAERAARAASSGTQ